ncbi:hypothetical protein [Terrarubrum flagellatum]|uniref:hypothetical protein n=1 Tax=Terrirubrum flagellatum TaxID=2895980 RepID=UPI0031453D5A
MRLQRAILIAAACLAATAIASGPPALAQNAAPAAEEEPTDLPDFPGREETFYFCIACHSFKVVGRQGMDRERWSGTLDWMTEKHGMAKLEGRDRDVVLDYLVKAYPQAATRGWRSPFAPQ